MAIPFPLHAHLEVDVSGNTCICCNTKSRVLHNPEEGFYIRQDGSRFRKGQNEREGNRLAWDMLKDTITEHTGLDFFPLVEEWGYTKNDIERGRRLKPRHYQQIIQRAWPDHGASKLANKRYQRSTQLQIHKGPNGEVDASYRRTIEKVNSHSPHTPSSGSTKVLELMEKALE